MMSSIILIFNHFIHMVTIFGENLPVASNMAQSHPLLWCIEVWNLSTWQFIFKNIICGISEFLTNIIYDWFLDFRPGFILCCFQPRWVLVRDWLAASSWSHLHRPPPPIWTHLDISFGWMSLWPGWPDCFSPKVVRLLWLWLLCFWRLLLLWLCLWW